MSALPPNSEPSENGVVFPVCPREGASPSLSFTLSERELSRLRDQLIRAAGDPRLAILGIPPTWCLALASHLTALLNGWLEP